MTDPLLVLQRIACGEIPIAYGRGFRHLSKAMLIAMAREVCVEQKLSFAAKDAWRDGAMPKKARKRLKPRKALADVEIPKKVFAAKRRVQKTTQAAFEASARGNLIVLQRRPGVVERPKALPSDLAPPSMARLMGARA